jgi:hypothetical protein
MARLLYINKLKLLILIILIFFIAFLAIKNTREDNKQNEILRKEFPIISKTDLISGIVIAHSSNRGSLHVILLNNTKISIPHSRNYNYTPPYLDEFIKNKDSLFKKTFSDTLFIFRDNRNYYFIIGKFIEQNCNMK